MKVLIFNHSFFNVSETFVYKQVTGMPADVQISLMGFGFMNEDKFPLSCRKYNLSRFEHGVDRMLTQALRKLRWLAPGFSLFSRSKVKQILRRDRPDIIHAHFGFNALIIAPLAAELNIPLVVTFHGVDASPEYLGRPYYKKAVQRVIEQAAGIIVVSPHMVEQLGLKKTSYLIPCCVDPDEFNPTERKDHPCVRILHSGRLISKKGVPDLIRVCRELGSIQLDIIGDGPELEECRRLAQGDTRIRFHGAQPHEVVKRFMAEADIFVLNSRRGDSGDMEGMPVSVLEAMSMELAVVSTYHAGIPMAITHRREGWLVPEKDNPALLQALRELIGNPGLRRELGVNARKRVIHQFTVQQMNGKIYRVYKTVGTNRLPTL